MTPAIAINLLLSYARNALHQLSALRQPGLSAAPMLRVLPRRFARNPARAELRLVRGFDWSVALARTLAGARTYLPLPKVTPTTPRPATPRPVPALRSTTPRAPGPNDSLVRALRKQAAILGAMRRAFSTKPTGQIAASIARRMGISEASDYWPTGLLAITETPAAYADRVHPPESRPPIPTGKPLWGAKPATGAAAALAKLLGKSKPAKPKARRGKPKSRSPIPARLVPQLE